MKKNKILISALILLTVISFLIIPLTACNGSGSNNTLSGKYYIVMIEDIPDEFEGSYLEFKTDNTFMGYQAGQTMNGEYVFDGKYVSLTSSLGSAVKKYSVSADKKTLSYVDNPSQQWKKK